MKNHQKYAKLPQDLDLSFQSDLDLLPDTAADIDVDEFNLTGTPPAGLVLNVDDDHAGVDDDGDNDDDDEDDEIVIATQVVGGGGGDGGSGASGGNGGGLRLATRKQRKQRKQQLEHLYNKKNKICGLGSDSIIEVSNELNAINLIKLQLVVIDKTNCVDCQLPKISRLTCQLI